MGRGGAWPRREAARVPEQARRQGCPGFLMSPITEFDHADKGEALYAMELALSLEKLNYEKLVDVHRVADEQGDPSLTDFIEGEYLEEQVEAIKKVSTYVSQLRRIGKGEAVWHFDRALAN